MQTSVTRSIFLWCLASIYLFAFVSLYFQIPGLYGNDGLMPARLHLEEGKRSATESFWIKPTLLWFAPLLNLSVDSLMDLICILGAGTSFAALLSTRLRNFVSFGLLWFLYFSLYQAGQTFLWFQWDILLLETGFLCVILAPWSLCKTSDNNPRFGVCFWLIKWLIFRLMFQSGVVKLTSQCPTWWGLTALNYHYESQCLPTALAWYAHQLPEWFQKLSVALTFVIEIGIPFLFFFPLKSIRIFSFLCQIFLQLLIIATGNYTFINLLTITLCVSLLDDEFLINNLPLFLTKLMFTDEDREKLSKKKRSLIIKAVSLFVQLSVGAGLFYWTVKLFDLRLDPKHTVSSRVAFSSEDFSSFLKISVPLSIGIASISFTSEIIWSFYKCISLEGIKNKLVSCVKTILFCFVAIWLFSVSLIPYATIEKDTQSKIWPVIQKWHRNMDQYPVANAYGLFRSMTGVGGRPEIVVEGSNNINGPWQEYHFLYKPGKLDGAPSFVSPHQPRLDWQMWFAALGHYQYNPWFINLIDKLLNNKKDVVALLAGNPFPKKAPNYIKSTLYAYHYTRVAGNTTSISEGLTNAGKLKDWWWRDRPAEYTPVLSKDNPDVKNFLVHHQLIVDGTWPENASGRLHSLLIPLRLLMHQLNPTHVMLWLVFVAFLFCIFKRTLKQIVRGKLKQD